MTMRGSTIPSFEKNPRGSCQKVVEMIWNDPTITLSLLSQHHYYHSITIITASLLSHYHSITTITASLLSQHHYYHTITIITASLLSQHHYYHCITIITLSQHHYYHSITIITASLLSHHHYYHSITTITLSLHHYYHTITASLLSQHHYYHTHHSHFRYAHCWVQVGVAMSLLRALGIPCRAVTLYEAAAVTKQLGQVNRFFTVEGDLLTDQQTDQLWYCN